MYKQCQTEQSAKRQRELELGLMGMMARKRFSEITVAELCQELGVPRKAFYRYFDSKEGALYALLDHTLMEMESVYMVFPGGYGAVDPQKAMERLFEQWLEHRELMTALENSGLLGILTERVIRFSNEHKTIPAFAYADDPKLKAYGRTFINTGLMSILYQWHCEHYVTSVEDMARLTLRIFRDPLFQPRK